MKFILQQITNLNSPIIWSLATDTEAVNGTTNSITIISQE